MYFGDRYFYILSKFLYFIYLNLCVYISKYIIYLYLMLRCLHKLIKKERHEMANESLEK
jgi:hypothetical protein